MPCCPQVSPFSSSWQVLARTILCRVALSLLGCKLRWAHVELVIQRDVQGHVPRACSLYATKYISGGHLNPVVSLAVRPVGPVVCMGFTGSKHDAAGSLYHECPTLTTRLSCRATSTTSGDSPTYWLRSVYDLTGQGFAKVHCTPWVHWFHVWTRVPCLPPGLNPLHLQFLGGIVGALLQAWMSPDSALGQVGASQRPCLLRCGIQPLAAL